MLAVILFMLPFMEEYFITTLSRVSSPPYPPKQVLHYREDSIFAG